MSFLSFYQQITQHDVYLKIKHLLQYTMGPEKEENDQTVSYESILKVMQKPPLKRVGE